LLKDVHIVYSYASATDDPVGEKWLARS
jgi:hypothetical protein